MSNKISVIHQLIENRRAVVCASDVPCIVSYYVEDIIVFDTILQPQFKGRDACQKHRQACIGICRGPMVFGIAELQAHTDQQVVFAYYLYHCGGTGLDGQPYSSWVQVSAGYRR